MPGNEVAKITLAVTEPNFQATEPNKAVPVAQITMPLVAFIHSTGFFLNVIDSLVKNGVFTREQVTEIMNSAGGRRE